MLDRLIGQETEYAIRLDAGGGTTEALAAIHERPSNQRVYQAVIAALKTRVSTRPGRGSKLEALFVENGGAFCYEVVPWALDAGLLEGGTPECRGPSQLLLYQRAQEAMLRDALTRAKPALHAAGIADVGLLKNCRDAYGNVYGAQENYEVQIARGGWLRLYRLGLVALAPISLLFTLVAWIYVALLVLFAVPAMILLFVVVAAVAMLGGRFASRLDRLFDDSRTFEKLGSQLVAPLQHLSLPLGSPFTLWTRFVAFRELRGGLTTFLVSRPIVSGAGSLEEDGTFVLAEKPSGIRTVQRSFATVTGRAMLDTGNLVKRFMGSFSWYRSYASLFSARQRLQLGLSDSNRAQVAEYLKIGTTCLIVDMIEAGALADAPELKAPVEALQKINADPTLAAKVHTKDGTAWTALELQRWYLKRAQAFVAASATPSLEAREVLRLWGECLDLLERDPGLLVGRIDWVTKRWLIEETAAGERPAVRKKVDLKYHELGEGYFERLEDVGMAPLLVSRAEVERAIHEPPEATPARMRGRLIRELGEDQKVRVDWASVQIGGAVGGKVIRLDDFRK
ncbi:MAG: proteasome accessory factor PafA2 family protein [Myxococcota bacterium]